MPISDWKKEEQPRERLFTYGSKELSSAELLALICVTGLKGQSALQLGQEWLAQSPDGLRYLGGLSPSAWLRFPGVGRSKAGRLSAAFELGRRALYTSQTSPVRIGDSEEAYELLRPQLGHLAHEEFWVLYLNNAHLLLCEEQLSKGGMTGTLVDVRMVVRKALELGSMAILVAHNHPSGSLTPSASDRQITQKLATALGYFEIRLLDHLIITKDHYYSFADRQLL